ncbi:hypothetical protein SAMN05216410_2081 [Sanguibacter gelidistatuariae]|uniref:Uncharacterized protein n=1 Tax=Sanguibacter gelidistatuariae TaxID=1814289 RepID=A0A1G6N863_9MICO|nr:hypothetical protein SAMN05216410_2081 [Sanguibacter gelidistatuariae]
MVTVRDMLSIVTSFSGSLYGWRSAQAKLVPAAAAQELRGGGRGE